jgi:hypothetical protein
MIENTLALAYLADRGITQETVSDNRIEVCTRVLARDYRLRLEFDQWHTGPLHEIIKESIWFSCRDQNTNIHSWIVRPFPTLTRPDGAEVKFLTPKGGNGYPFIPQKTWEVKDKSNKPLVITEGPCKALAALQAGGFPIAVNGVWMATTNNGGATQLHQVLIENFAFLGRPVFIAFDADYATNSSVRQALIRTVVLVHKAGAEVKLLTWPASDGKGLDDYLAKNSNGSQAKAFEALVEKAITLKEAIRECDLEFVELELTRARLRSSKLAQLSRLLAPALKIPAATLEHSIQAEYEEGKQQCGMESAEPWAETVDGPALADELVRLSRLTSSWTRSSPTPSRSGLSSLTWRTSLIAFRCWRSSLL